MHRSPPLARNQGRGRRKRQTRREFVLRSVTHNVQSLRQAEGIELHVVISSMREQDMGIYAMQET